MSEDTRQYLEYVFPLLTAFGIGALIGTLLAGAVRPPRALGRALLGMSAAIGAGRRKCVTGAM